MKSDMKNYKKDSRYKTPEQQISTYDEFSKRWRGFLKGTNMDSWKDD